MHGRKCSQSVVYVLLATVALAGPPAQAAEPLTLDEAIAAAMSGNHQLGAARAGAAAAAATAREAESYRWPRLDLQEVYSRTTNPVYVFMNLLGQENFGPANFDPAYLNSPPPLNNWNTKVSVSQALYAGGKIRSGVAAARLGSEAAEADAEHARQQVVHAVIEAYTGAVLASAHLKVAEEALATARAHVKLVEDLRQSGMVVESDLLQARVQQSEVEEQVVQARAVVEIARAGLNMAMGRGLDEPLALPEAIDVPPPPAEGLEQFSRSAVENRRDLQAMDRRVRAADQMVHAARAGYLPEVGVTGSWEANREGGPGSDGSNWSIFAAAKFAAFEGGATRARLARAREEKRAAEQMNAALRDAAGLDVRRAWYDLQSARQRLELAGASVAQARAALSIVEDRYREGLTTVVELMGAQTTLSAARTREVAARRDVLLGRATLDLAAGRL